MTTSGDIFYVTAGEMVHEVPGKRPGMPLLKTSPPITTSHPVSLGKRLSNLGGRGMSASNWSSLLWSYFPPILLRYN